MKPYHWSDEELEGWNDGSASLTANERISVESYALNALICEVQAWRRHNAEYTFKSGPNTIQPRVVEKSQKYEDG